MSENTPFMKVNDSDKQRPSDGKILPDMQGHTTSGEDGGCGETMKRHKFKIIGVLVVLLVAIILGVTLSGGSDPAPTPVPPGPVPPPPPIPPVPINRGYNPYWVNETAFPIEMSKNKVSGVLQWNQTVIDDGGDKYGEDQNLTLKPGSIPIGDNNKYLKAISYEFSQVDYKITKVQFTDVNKTRYSIPDSLVGSMPDSYNMSLDTVGFKMFKEPFGFEFRSTRQAEVINVHTNGSDFLMTDKFMQLDLQMPSGRIYGMGERTREFSLVPGTWTMWANGRETPYDDGSGGKQTYGVHPFALVQTQEKDDWMGIFFRNSNAQSPIITNKTDGNYTLTYVSTGGQLEMYFFTKGSSKEIIKAYHNMIGKPTLTPFWSLGWQAASYDYKDLATYQKVIDGYKTADIPLEGVFFDIPYLAKGADFSVNQTAFPNLKTWSQTLKTNNQKLTVIIDGGISADDFENYYYSMASDQKVLLKSAINEGWLTQHVWSKKSVFLDFMNDQAAAIWMHGINALFEEVEYDGLWLDMNEATGFCDGECVNGTVPTPPSSAKKYERRSLKEKIMQNTEKFVREDILGGGEQNNTWYNSWLDQNITNSTFFLPFSPGPDNMDHMSLSLNATHVDGSSEYNLHSLFGHSEGMQTHNILSDITYNTNIPAPLKDQRTFLLSRSTFAGSGKYVQHWLGDNHRNWDNMKWSIAGIMNFNMFGIPMVGPDTCGFFEDKALNETQQKELCARWIELSVFYPFARQHHDTTNSTTHPEGRGGPAMEPYNLGGTAENTTEYADMAKFAIKERFSYLTHMYTCMLRVHREGGTCFDPLLMHYPHDDAVFAVNETEHTFLVGDAIKVSPVLEPGVIEIMSYFPNGEWLDLRTYGKVTVAAEAPLKGQKMQLSAEHGINAHLRPGYMIPKEMCDTCNTTFDLKTTGKIQMIINPDTEGHAEGELFIDIGNSISELSTQTYEYYQFQYSAGSIKKWVKNNKNTGPVGKGVDSFVIANAKKLLSTNFACWTSEVDGSATPLKITTSARTNTVTLSATDGNAIQPYFVRNIFFGNTDTSLNLCGANGTATAGVAQFYKMDADPDLSSNNVTINITGNTGSESVQPGLSLFMHVLNADVHDTHSTDILAISWTFTSHTKAGKMPYMVPLDIAGIDKTILSDEGILSSWVEVHRDNTTGSFEIRIKNQRVFFTLTSEMSFGDYINVIKGTAHTYPGTTGNETFKGVMGLVQQTTSDLFLGDGMYSLWARDPVDPQQTLKPHHSDIYNSDHNGYSTHPFVFGKATDRTWFGVFVNNAAAQDWYIKNNATSGDVDMRILSTGGIGDMYFFTGNNPNEVTQAYHKVVGNPVVTPQWALGWHQSQWGYKNTAAIKKVADGFFENDLPLETLWADIDYMHDYKDFTVDQTDFGDLGTYLQSIKTSNHIKFIPIVDAGIAQRQESVDNYTTYTEGVKQDVFIKSGATNWYKYSVLQFTAQVWAGDAAFVDFTSLNAQPFWSGQLDALNNNLSLSIDGIWLNSNEATNMQCNGVCYTDQKADNPVQWMLPYIPTGANLETRAMPLDAIHYDGITELDLHSLYGTMQTQKTDLWFQAQPKKRTMIIGRSSYAGYGKFGSQWLGDNYSKPEYMGYSVTGTMAHNIAGIPLVGADICGFMGNTNAELCARWYMVGAFQPLSRNHNAIGNDPQLPWNFPGVYLATVTYNDIIKQAMYTKLSLIRYYYTQMSIVQREGGAFYKPLFFEYPNDDGAYTNQELNIMLGPALKLGIQSKALTTVSQFYYPVGRYCEVFCKKETDCCVEYTVGTEVSLPSLAFNFYLDLRAGHIIPMQNATKIEASQSRSINTESLQDDPVEIHLMPLCDTTSCTATGEYINDDGVTRDIANSRHTYKMSYTHTINTTVVGAAPDTMEIDIVATGPDSLINGNDKLGAVQIYDATHLNITSTVYDVTVTEKAKTDLEPIVKSVGSTTFRVQDDRLWWIPRIGVAIDELRDITKITFTKQA